MVVTWNANAGAVLPTRRRRSGREAVSELGRDGVWGRSSSPRGRAYFGGEGQREAVRSRASVEPTKNPRVCPCAPCPTLWFHSRDRSALDLPNHSLIRHAVGGACGFANLRLVRNRVPSAGTGTCLGVGEDGTPKGPVEVAVSGFLLPHRSTVVQRPVILDALLPPGHLARTIWEILCSLDFSELEGTYRSVVGGPGRPPLHPRVLAALWVYGMTQGLETAPVIAAACGMRDDFRWLAGGLHPCDQTLLNFLRRAQVTIRSVWVQILQAMHREGHIDLSVIAEDGTKLRADASPRSFHTAEEINVVIARLEAGITERLARAADAPPTPKDQAQLRRMQLRAARAQQAARELEERAARRAEHDAPSRNRSAVREVGGARERDATRPSEKFGVDDFRREDQRDVMVCPAGEDLRLIGTYATDNGRGAYRLYGRRDCGGCALRAQCTDAKGRRLKVLVTPTDSTTTQASVDSREQPGAEANVAGSPELKVDGSSRGSARGEDAPKGPRASLTDPEAVFMLATSEKRFEPSYNADLAVTRHGIIVSQFLTKRPTDFHHFEPAVNAVITAIGRPERWVGDGHYGTIANLALAHQLGIPLYAPPMTSDTAEGGRFANTAFRHDAAKDLLICPEGKELVKLGTYGRAEGRTYDLYQRRDCGDCASKTACTDAPGRRVKRYESHPLVEQLDVRMKDGGDAMRKLRSSTVEPVNAQVKQHGLRRFHVRGLAKCATVLTLACIAHNLMKWNARRRTLELKLAA
jgi:transposase